jgi:hypothetical protein
MLLVKRLDSTTHAISGYHQRTQVWAGSRLRWPILRLPAGQDAAVIVSPVLTEFSYPRRRSGLILLRSRQRPVAVVEGSFTKNLNKTGVRLWTEPSHVKRLLPPRPSRGLPVGLGRGVKLRSRHSRSRRTRARDVALRQ